MSRGRVHADFETQSEADLKKVGAWKYSLHSSTDVICLSYKINDGPKKTWWPGCEHLDLVEGVPGTDMPSDLADAVLLGYEFHAFNVGFEWAIWLNVLVKRFGWLPLYLPNLRDTMAVAAYYCLPQNLEKLAEVLGPKIGHLPKDPEGSRLITKYCKLHLKTAKQEIPDEDFFKFVDYCEQDVEVEHRIAKFLGDLPERELRIFQLSCKMNQYGIPVNREDCLSAFTLATDEAASLVSRFTELTGITPKQNAKLKDWFKTQGLELENTQADTLTPLLKEDIPPKAKEAIRLRNEANKASGDKAGAFLRAADNEGRCRWQVVYHGASTGRKVGRGVQVFNMSRGFEDVNPQSVLKAIRTENPKLLRLLFGDVVGTIGKSTRHLIQAALGKVLLFGDWVSIEAVVLSCLAGEEWKIEAFRRGDKIYERTAELIFNLPPGTVSKKTHPVERQTGKTGELAFGFQGSVGAWRNFDDSDRYTDEEVKEFAKVWREKHPEIVKFWYALDAACVDAVQNPDEVFEVNGLVIEVIEEWLTIRLLNGKRLWYWSPELRMGMPPWHDPELKEECALRSCKCRPRLQVTYMTWKQGRFVRTKTYGGKICENVTQATARELLNDAMLALDDAGFDLFLDVYDEIVAEVPEDNPRRGLFEKIMLEARGDWARDWPISVDLTMDKVYRK